MSDEDDRYAIVTRSGRRYLLMEEEGEDEDEDLFSGVTINCGPPATTSGGPPSMCIYIHTRGKYR
jgi:hypothetical protein